MSDFFERLAEAKIRDWQRRKDAGEEMPVKDPLPIDNWENQALRDIIAMRRRARTLPEGDERQALETQANHLHIQLMVTVERDRPLLAQTLAAHILDAVQAP